MPQSKERKAQYQKDFRKRGKGLQEKGTSREGTSPQGTSTVETAPPAYIHGITDKFQFLPERPRYLTLKDGQVLDRLNQPEPTTHLKEMNACNEIEMTETGLFGDSKVRNERIKGYKTRCETLEWGLSAGTLAKLSMIKAQLKAHNVLDGVFYGSTMLKSTIL